MDQRILKMAAPLTLVLLLSACGGDSGDSGFTPPTISSTPITITPDNQYEVASAAVSSVGGALGGAGTVTGVVVDNGSSTINTLEYAKSTVFKFAKAAVVLNQSSPAAVGASFSESGSCVSGSITISGNVTDLNGGIAYPGDVINFSFNNCTDVDGSTTNGSFSFTIVSGILDLNADSFVGSISVDFNNLRSTTSGETFVMDGDITINQNGATVTVSGQSLYSMIVGGEAVHLTNFTITTVTSGTTETVSMTMTVASTTLNGVITFATDPNDPLVQDMSESNPQSGTIIITGGTTTLTMVILSTTSVELTLDSNSDGVADAGYPITVTWTEIEAGAGTI